MSVTSAYRTGVRVLRGSPMLASMAVGWLASEYPPRVVAARDRGPGRRQCAGSGASRHLW